MYTYAFDINKKVQLSDCNLYPTEVNKSESPWLYAINNKYTYDEGSENSVILGKGGKWMLFLSASHVNDVWDKIKAAIETGNLWSSKVSTTEPVGQGTYAIMIYTKDYSDKNDVIHVLNYLETSGIKSPSVTIKYKTDEQTRAGIYSGGNQKPWIYSSDTIRGMVSERSDYLSWRKNT